MSSPAPCSPRSWGTRGWAVTTQVWPPTWAEPSWRVTRESPGLPPGGFSYAVPVSRLGGAESAASVTIHVPRITHPCADNRRQSGDPHCKSASLLVISASQIYESRRLRSMLRFPIEATPPQAVTAPVAPGAAGRWRGGPAAKTDPEAEREAADSPVAGTSPVAGAASLLAGGCLVWPLSLDATCAGESRRVFRERSEEHTSEL